MIARLVGAPWAIATAKPPSRSAPTATGPAAGPRSGRESVSSFSNGFVGSGLNRPLTSPLCCQAATTSRCSEAAGTGAAPAVGVKFSPTAGWKTSL